MALELPAAASQRSRDFLHNGRDIPQTADCGLQTLWLRQALISGNEAG
jgi:hypothetical protein